MKMKKLKLRQEITSILIARIVLITWLSLTGCSDSEYPNNNSTFVDNNNEENKNSKTKTFQLGEHIISKNITDEITEEDENNPYNEITQVEYHDRYKCVRLGVSVYAPYKGSRSSFDEASITYINGNDVYTDFGNSKGYKKMR